MNSIFPKNKGKSHPKELFDPALKLREGFNIASYLVDDYANYK